MLINLIGPVAVGKTYFAQKFIERNPGFVYISIDQERDAIYQEYIVSKKDQKPSSDDRRTFEENAWQRLFDKCREHPFVIMETSGLSWRLKQIIEYKPLVKKGIYTVKLIGHLDKCRTRLQKRIAKCLNKVNDEYSFFIQLEDVLEWTHAEIGRAPHNLIINVDSDENYDIMFKEAERYIINATNKYIDRLFNNNLLESNIFKKKRK